MVLIKKLLELQKLYQGLSGHEFTFKAWLIHRVDSVPPKVPTTVTMTIEMVLAGPSSEGIDANSWQGEIWFQERNWQHSKSCYCYGSFATFVCFCLAYRANVKAEAVLWSPVGDSKEGYTRRGKEHGEELQKQMGE